MVSNQVLGARAAAGLVAMFLAVSGCSHFGHHDAAAAPTATANPAPLPPPSTVSAVPEDVTATQAAIAAGNVDHATASAAVDTRGAVNPSAPMHYTVKKGDTLWGIASMYLKDPWLWPEVWVINPQIPNPHLIYPGDQLALAYGGDGRPHVSVSQAGTVRLDPRLRSEPLNGAIPTIQYAAIAAFLSKPTIISEEQIRRAPYVLAFRDMHQAGGSGNEVYIRNLAAGENSRYTVVHVAGPLHDPDDHKLLGYEAIYTATALVQRAGDPAKAVLIDPARETLAGDRLLASEDTQAMLNFTLHPPSTNTRGRILDVVGGTDLVGLYQVVVINRGRSQGVDPGTVMAIDHKGNVVADVFRGGRNIGSEASRQFAPKVQLPSERDGTLLVFKSFDRASYALIVGAVDIIEVGDVVRNP